MSNHESSFRNLTQYYLKYTKEAEVQITVIQQSNKHIKDSFKHLLQKKPNRYLHKYQTKVMQHRTSIILT